MTDKAMTAERLAEIKARLEAATPGPWGIIDNGGDDVEVGRDNGDDMGYRLIATVPDGAMEEESDKHYMEQVANARLIAHAPEDISALLTEVARLQWREQATLAGLVQGRETCPPGDHCICAKPDRSDCRPMDCWRRWIDFMASPDKKKANLSD